MDRRERVAELARRLRTCEARTAALPTELVDCPHAIHCAGCPLIQSPYSAQLATKRDALQRALAPYPALGALSVGETVGAATVTGYRVRAKLVCAGAALGLYGHGSHDVVDIPDCRILSATVRSAVQQVRDMLPFDFPLLALDVREADAGALVTLIVPPEVAESALQAAADRLIEANPSIIGVSFGRRAARSPQVLGSSPRPLAGVASAPHHLSTRTPYLAAVPGGFVQAHPAQADALYRRIEQGLAEKFGALQGVRVLELYAGAGALSLRLAARGAHVTAVDSYEPNLRLLAETARAQAIELRTLAESAERALARSHGPEVVIVDPPRRGLSPSVRLALGALAPRALCYVSCEPQTLARDLAHLRELGLAVASLDGWDMIPLSDAVEALAWLEPGSPPPLRVLYEDERCVAIEKPAWIESEGSAPGSLVNRVRQLPGCEHAVAVNPLAATVSGIGLFARTQQRVPELAQALHAVDYLALVQGITHKRGRIARPVRGAHRPDPATPASSAPSRTRRVALQYVRERTIGTHSLLRVTFRAEPVHALREHFASLRHPLLGDSIYGNPRGNRYFHERHGLDREFLHCALVELAAAAGTLRLESPLPADLLQVLQSLRLDSAGLEPTAVEGQ